MNILVTGGSGFIGSCVSNFLKEHTFHIIYSPGRKELDVLNLECLRDYINSKKINLVIHTAITGGRRTSVDNAEVFYKNILMFENLLAAIHPDIKIINIGSGSEFDKRRDLTNTKEVELGNFVPIDYYGFSKYVIAKKIGEYENIVNLRIFNCFGINEVPNKFIMNAMKNKKIVIDIDKYMDFFYIEDLCKVVQYYINFPSFNRLIRDINCVYMQKYMLSDIAKIIGTPEIVIEKTNGLNYTGDGEILNDLRLPFFGLIRALEKMKESLCQK